MDLKRIEADTETRILDVVHDMLADRVPRLIEHHGRELAILAPPPDADGHDKQPKSARNRDAIMALASAWRDLDADQLIEYIHRAREESPPSPPA